MRKRFAVLLSFLLFALLLPAASSRLHAQEEKKEGPPAPTIKVGDEAPDFTLLDQNRKPVSLHDFRGKKSVALAFYIFAFTGG
jgi:cytochrome oxidase Cu insertion factor (SCO1/SenC/PrrC family)